MKRLRAQDGQALVELALVLPILLVVLFGIFEFGTAINDWNSETALANVGARYAAVGSLPSDSCNSSGTATIASYVQCEATSTYQLPSTSGTTGFQGANLTVSVCAPSGTSAGDPVEVQLSGGYKWLPINLLGLSNISAASLTSSATMRIETPSFKSSWLTGTCT